ncbi:hypothetical protein CsSME_00003274 [Camellia sinensis var. sinensis]
MAILCFSISMGLEQKVMIQRGSSLSSPFLRSYRWEFLLHQGRRIFVVGDLNIAPAAIDSCNPRPDFDKNKFRRWFKSILVENGGYFFDVFRAKHPERREAYTHWSQTTGAEEFNYGARIDHILSAGSCLHDDDGQKGHNFLNCHVKDCDIMMQFKRWRPGSSPRWKGGRNIKLEGSDHVPVYMSLVEIPDILQHSTPSLSARYAPEVRGFQQTIGARRLFILSKDNILVYSICRFHTHTHTKYADLHTKMSPFRFRSGMYLHIIKLMEASIWLKLISHVYLLLF